MTDHRTHSKTVAFPDADHADERIAAVLISKDADTGELKANVKAFRHRQPPSEDAVGMLVTATEIANL